MINNPNSSFKPIKGSTKSPGNPTQGMTALASTFRPGVRDVICARGKAAKDHSGNVWFRSVIEQHIDEYADCETKLDKSFLVSKIMKHVRKESTQAGFVKSLDGVWYEVGDRLSREKIGQTFRDMLHTQYRSSTKAKANVRKQRASLDGHPETSDDEVVHPSLKVPHKRPSSQDERAPPPKTRRLDGGPNHSYQQCSPLPNSTMLKQQQWQLQLPQQQYITESAASLPNYSTDSPNLSASPCRRSLGFPSFQEPLLGGDSPPSPTAFLESTTFREMYQAQLFDSEQTFDSASSVYKHDTDQSKKDL